MTDLLAIASILEEILEGEVEIVEELGSNVNFTYIIKQSENEFIVKLMTRKPLNLIEHHRFLKEKWIYECLRKMRLKSPRVLHADYKVRELEEINIYGLIILEKIAYPPLDTIYENFSKIEKLQFAEQFANLLKKLHSIEILNFGEIDGLELLSHNYKNESVQELATGSNWLQFLWNNVERSIYKLKSGGMMNNKLLDEVIQYFETNKSLIQYENVPKLVHNDIWRGNLLYDKGGDVYIVDWEWSIAGDPIFDLLWIETDIFRNDDIEIHNKFYEIYSMDNNSANFKLKIKLYSIYSTLVNAAFGFVAHNPSEEGYRRIENFLNHYLKDKPLD